LENDTFLELHSSCMLTDWRTIYNLKVFGSKKIKGLIKRMAKNRQN